MSKLRKRSLKLKVDPLRLRMSLRYQEEMGEASSVKEIEDQAIGEVETNVIDHQPNAGSAVPKLKKRSV